jgi:H+/Cl- antiporter ClcA
MPPVSIAYVACIVGGLVLGLLFGDRVLPNLGAALGYPLADIFLGAFGGLCAGIACETVGEVLAALLRLRRSKS